MSHKSIYKPIFIIGPERSGTTLLYSLLANADNLYWFSRIDSILPSAPGCAEIFRRIFSLTEKNSFTAKYQGISSMSGINTPSECIPYWKKVFKYGDEENYNIRNDLFTAEDVTPTVRKKIYQDFEKRLYYSKKNRLLFKQPGFSLKVTFWNALFEDALFLVCVRNIDDNIHSYVKAKEQSDEKFWGTKVPGWKTHFNDSYELQAVFQLKEIYKYMGKVFSSSYLRKRFCIVPYEQLVNTSRKMLEEVLEFSEIKWNQSIEASLKSVVDKNTSIYTAKSSFKNELEILDRLYKEADEAFKAINHIRR